MLERIIIERVDPLDFFFIHLTLRIVEHSHITDKVFRDLMLNTGQMARDIGTTVVGPDAVRYGLVDEIGGLGQAIKKLQQFIQEKKAAPEADKSTEASLSKGVVQ